MSGTIGDPLQSCGGWGGRFSRMNVSTAWAKPSFSLDVVTRRAARCTSVEALPMAMLSPDWANIKTSLGMSPIMAICEVVWRIGQKETSRRFLCWHRDA